ncbi:Transcription factor BYE1 [Escovopsis weberi]|uniref:Transcription factor BYE1 n=1 Tax=Escovopsis weberi TaxID=150374 RepID=A0A0M8N7S1_ESCWE|nr:Transcription factor BYE1 [Escovopsis weberi]
MSGEPEPRRSVRATKGQHTKAFDDLELAMPKRRQTKKTKKAQEKEKEQSQDPEEIIRCVCGATEQDEDSGEAWISCETCFVWQHNVCVGVSSFEDEIPDYYWCEQCKPESHRELLDGIARGERPWEARRKAHEEEAERKKRKGGRKKGKRTSDVRDEIDRDSLGAKGSPTPDAAAAKQGKRKTREDSQDAEGKAPKVRRISEAAPSTSTKYSPPEDIATSITSLPGARLGPAKALKKSLSHVIAILAKNNQVDLPDSNTVGSMADMYALQIERAVFDTHPPGRGQKEYSQQIKSLAFNLKNNPELTHGLIRRVHSPMTLAVMTSEQLATAELQRQNAEMKARAEKQSILYTSDTGPRVRRTHKGEEIVEDESLLTSEAPMPTAGGPRHAGGDQTPRVKREHVSRDQQPDMPTSRAEGQQRSPSQSHFDIGKVFSAVRTPTAAHHRRPSAPTLKTSGPGIDPDVDRMLQDETESPPYSPTEDSEDPDIIWRGSLAMSSIADFQATAKYIGGANFSSFGPWTKLIPRQMIVAGRITQQSAIEYLCSLRYSNLTDIIVVNVRPVSPESKREFNNLINYFIGKKRYGVVGNKVAGNVRDTYLVPVPPGEDGHPEFMLNLVDNYIPKVRTEPLLLAVFVYRNEPEQLRQMLNQEAAAAAAASASQLFAATVRRPERLAVRAGVLSRHALDNICGNLAERALKRPDSMNPPIPHPPPPPAGAGAGAGGAAAAAAIPNDKRQMQEVGQAVAMEVLKGLITVPTVQFLLPQAFQMTRREWEVIRRIFESDTRAREDLKYLSDLLEKEGAEGNIKSEASGAVSPPIRASSPPRSA